ncbi:MAG: nucleoside deaminase [Candidatus Woesearchaeota archaeon]
MSEFMKLAEKEAIIGMKRKHGGPFGAVIVRKGKVIAKAHNEVIRRNDPTAHAEITAIRKASRKLKKFDLSDCEIYTTCEPCPMCLCAIKWAHMKRIFYGCSKDDARKIGFDDRKFYDLMKRRQKNMKSIDREHCLIPFEIWQNTKKKTMY